MQLINAEPLQIVNHLFARYFKESSSNKGNEVNTSQGSGTVKSILIPYPLCCFKRYLLK